MAEIKLKPGWVQQIIHGEVVEPIEMKFCGVCRAWTVEYHDCAEAVEPEIVKKEIKIAGLLTDSVG